MLDYTVWRATKKRLYQAILCVFEGFTLALGRRSTVGFGVEILGLVQEAICNSA